MRFQAVEGARFVHPITALTRDIGGEDRCKPTRCNRGCALARASAAIGDAALDECASLGHPVSPRFLALAAKL
jgi:hypothetical protein